MFNRKLLLSLLKVTDLVVVAASIAAALLITEFLTGGTTELRLLDRRFSLFEISAGLLYLTVVHLVLASRGSTNPIGLLPSRESFET